MPVTWEPGSDNLGIFRVSGTLDLAEYRNAQQVAEAAIQEHGHIRILIILDNFSGWEHAPGWEDMSFPERNDKYIDKIAIVGESKWQDLVYAFALKGLRPVPIEYFGADKEDEARRWLGTGR